MKFVVKTVLVLMTAASLAFVAAVGTSADCAALTALVAEFAKP